jgi:hypothetical protein
MEARALRATALKAMKELPPERSLKAVSAAFGTAWKQELLLLGDPTERSEELSLKEAMLKRWNEWANPSPKGKPSEEGEAES